MDGADISKTFFKISLVHKAFAKVAKEKVWGLFRAGPLMGKVAKRLFGVYVDAKGLEQKKV